MCIFGLDLSCLYRVLFCLEAFQLKQLKYLLECNAFLSCRKGFLIVFDGLVCVLFLLIVRRQGMS